MAERIPQSVELRAEFWAFLSSDHVTPATGKTIAITISKNGAAFGNPSGGATNATEIANGWYYVDLSTTDTGTLGPLILKGTEGTIDQVGDRYRVVNPNNAGLAALPDTAVATNASLITAGTGTSQLSVTSGRANADVTAISTDTTAADNLETALDGGSFNVGGGGIVAASVTGNVGGTVATVTNLTNAPTAGDFTAVMKTSLNASTPASIQGAVASVTGNVGGNVNGNVVGSVGSVVGLTASNLDTTVSSRASAANLAIVDAKVDAIGSIVVTNLDATVSSRATPAQVNAQVIDVLTVDAGTAPTGVPSAVDPIATKIGRLHQALMSPLDISATEKLFGDEAGSPLWKKTLADDGTNYTESTAAAP